MQHLDENAAWIKAIIDNTALGRVDQATQCVPLRFTSTIQFILDGGEVLREDLEWRTPLQHFV